MTTVRRGWRWGLELVLFVSTLVLCVGLSLLTNVAPSGPVAPIGRWSAPLRLLNAADAAGARQLTSSDRTTSSPDADDEDDDGDDSDGFTALPAVAIPAPEVNRSVGWLLIHPAFEPLFSLASDNHSLRAPPQ